MTPGRITLLITAIGVLLGISWAARTYLATRRCERLGMEYIAGKGCIKPLPVILERGLKHTLAPQAPHHSYVLAQRSD